MYIDDLPGFRRRIIVTPRPGRVRGDVEDDYHCMAVTVHHDGKIATAVEPDMERAPWSTCPGAVAQLRRTFTGVALESFAARGEKFSNCTHLHDLAVLAAAHAADDAPLVYDILVSDPIAGQRGAELRRNGETILSWTLAGFRFVEPQDLAGMTLDKLRPWLASLDLMRREAARLLRWGVMIANGRGIPLEQQSDASKMPVGNCYTFQAQVSLDAKRVGEIREFSGGGAPPLEKRIAAVSECRGPGIFSSTTDAVENYAGRRF